MNAEIISVGTELLLGEIVNSDAQMISEGLSMLGINVYYHTVVGDNPERVKSAVNTAIERADILITTGGLGPTCDDLTKETLAQAFGKKLVFNQEALDNMVEIFRSFGNKPMTENNKKQAMVPEGAEVFQNRHGTAPGCAFEAMGKLVIMLPGPPRECRPMFFDQAVPYLARYSGGAIASQTIKIFGLGESAMEEKLRFMMDEMQNPTVAPYAKEGECLVRVTAKAEDEEKAHTLTKPVVEKICEILGDVVYGVDVRSLEEVVVNGLKEAGMTLSVAESCTGGLLAKRLTDIPGSSACFTGGICAYTKEMKAAILGVSRSVIAEAGVVSKEVASQMAEGVRRLTKSDIGIGVTGVAGPGEDADHNPEGLVYIAVSDCDGTEVVEMGGRRHGRQRNRLMAASTALDLVRRRYRL